jgi:hypothetical protein
MIVNLIENLAAPVAAIVAILLAVLDPLGPIGRAFATHGRASIHTIRARLRAIRALSCDVGAVFDPPRPIFAGRKLTGGRTALATSVLQELGGSAAGNSGPDCGAQIRAARPRTAGRSGNRARGRFGHVQEVL